MIGVYKLTNIIGEGSFSKVKHAVDTRDSSEVAIKIINKKRIVKAGTPLESVHQEISLLKLMRHPNIVKLKEVHETERSIFMVLELAKNGELFEYIVNRGPLPEGEALCFFQQIIFAIEYCHNLSIAHRDIKPENILLDEHFNIKITDFGMSKLAARDGGAPGMVSTSCGSPHYAAPELLTGGDYDAMAADVWSIGVVLYALINAHLPFEGGNLRKLLSMIKNGEYKVTPLMNKRQRDLISKILCVDPTKRATLQEIKTHPWFTQNLLKHFKLPNPMTAFDIRNPIKDAQDDIIQLITSLNGYTKEEVLDGLSRSGTTIFKILYTLYKQREASRCSYSALEARRGAVSSGSSSAASLRAITPKKVSRLRNTVMSKRRSAGDMFTLIRPDRPAAPTAGADISINVSDIRKQIVFDDAAYENIVTLGTPRVVARRRGDGKRFLGLFPKKNKKKKKSSSSLKRNRLSSGLTSLKLNLLEALEGEAPAGVVWGERGVSISTSLGLLEIAFKIQFALDILGLNWVYPNLRRFEVHTDRVCFRIKVKDLRPATKDDFLVSYTNPELFKALYRGKKSVVVDSGNRDERSQHQVDIKFCRGDSGEFYAKARMIVGLILLRCA